MPLVTDDPNPSVARLTRAWKARGYVAQLRELSRRHRRPVLFTELGYRSRRGTAGSPWEWSHAGGAVAQRPQHASRLRRQGLVRPQTRLRWRQGSLDGRSRQAYLDRVATGLTLEQLSAPIEADSRAGVLARVRAAAATASELRGLGDELLDRYVQAARADGASWSEIGAALGVTKQAAHERFVAAPLAWPQNFNQPARVVVARAIKEARGFGHRYLGTEHLLLALTAEQGLAGTTLARLGVSAHGVRVSIERIIGRGPSGGSATLGITPRTKRVLEAAVREAKRVGRERCADSQHLLLALAASDGVARDILAQHGAEEDALRERLASLIEREAPEIAAKLRAPKRRGVRRRSRA
jgi:hypothetical protein